MNGSGMNPFTLHNPRLKPVEYPPGFTIRGAPAVTFRQAQNSGFDDEHDEHHPVQ